MSVYVHAAIGREVQRLQQVALSANVEGCTPAEYSLIHTAIEELQAAQTSIRLRLDAAVAAANA